MKAELVWREGAWTVERDEEGLFVLRQNGRQVRCSYDRRKPAVFLSLHLAQQYARRAA